MFTKSNLLANGLAGWSRTRPACWLTLHNWQVGSDLARLRSSYRVADEIWRSAASSAGLKEALLQLQKNFSEKQFARWRKVSSKLLLTMSSINRFDHPRATTVTIAEQRADLSIGRSSDPHGQLQAALDKFEAVLTPEQQ